MGFVRRHPILTLIAAVVSAALGVLSVTALAVWRSAHLDEASLRDNVDVIAVLGAAQYNGRPSPTFEGRLDHAALLYRRGFAPAIVVLGGGRPGDLTTEAEAGRAWLVERQSIPADDVFAHPQGRTTLESVRAASRWMERRRLDTAFLVTDPWHNLRVRRMARDNGIEAFVSATFRSAARSQWTRFEGYSRETFAYVYYRLVGR